MSFFSRLRKRLGKSSSGLETAIDDLVSQDSGETSGLPDQSQPDMETGTSGGGMLGRIATGLAKVGIPLRRRLDREMRDELEELLIMADMGVETSCRLADSLAKRRFGHDVTSQEIRGMLADDIARLLDSVEKPIMLGSNRPDVILIVGVNGSGKTTTIGKLASQYRNDGKSVIIAAADTFRAAAVEQLEIWGERAGVPVFSGKIGTDPASIAYRAYVTAMEKGADVLLVDTAGRLQNRKDLMEELAKIVRVIRKLNPVAPHNTVLVLDATTGQNAVSQVEVFNQIANLSGLIMTKLDGTARGGILVAIADRYGIPIHAIGIGEGIEDLSTFVARDYAHALIGLEAVQES